MTAAGRDEGRRMSFRTKRGVPVIAAEADDVCQLCNKVAKCRPYGPNGERICYECGMKDKATTERMMAKVLFGEGEIQ
jgi:hypothetical protein